jgi:alkylation response protein AidB-like acyl-CoA dehydrogenase
MHFEFSDEQRLFQTTLRDFLRKECPPDRVRALWDDESGRSDALWRKLAELGLPGLLAPAARGGLGMDEIDLVLLLEEVGRAALAEPVVGHAAVGVPLLGALGGRFEGWLERAAAGEARLAVGHPVSPFVADAHVADLLLLAHGDELHALERGAAGFAITRQPANDPARRIFTVAWTPSPATLVAGASAPPLLDAALDRGALACAAELVGAAEQMIDLAVAHACQREQFGRPIGSFQAVQHMLANAKIELEYARPVVYRAAHSLARPTGRRAVEVSHAKLAAGRAAARAARAALQVHGAIGYTWEQDLQIWMRRAWSLELEWGDGAFHRRRVADAVLAPGARIGPGCTFEGDE